MRAVCFQNLAVQMSKGCKRFHSYDAAIPVRQYGNETLLFLVPYVLAWQSPENHHPSSVEEMARSMICLIKQVKPNGPCSLAGYSGGGILAYEIAKQLISCGYPVPFLGLIDTYAETPTTKDFFETGAFLTYLEHKYPAFEALRDSE